MEEDKGLEKDQQPAEAGEESLDQELDLNVEAPADSASMEALSQEENESAEDTDSGPEPEASDDQGQDEPVSEEVDGDADLEQAGTEDEIGINIEDDELWDEGETEEIPLFEEELLSEISQEEEQELEAEDAAGKEPAEGAEEAVSAPDGSGTAPVEAEEASGSEAASGVSQEDSDSDEPTEEAKGAAAQDSESSPGLVMTLLPWAVTGLSLVLIALSVVTIYFLWNHPLSQKHSSKSVRPVPSPVTPVPQSAPSKPATNPVQAPYGGASQREAIDLAPFIIPGKSGGELVFFKLQVELVVPDATTKQELLRRQAWLRDIIYQELKGLDISRGVQGDILGRYRQPLLSRLNKEFSPLRIEDIRLMGYLLR